MNKEYDPVVLDFIGQIADWDDTVMDLFSGGYCWHFARLLQTTFGRGTLALTEPFGHIVWVDHNGCAYDIDGAYDPETSDCDRLLDLRFLGDLVRDFMHVPGLVYQAPEPFHAWADSLGWDDTYAMTRIYLDLPKDVKENIPHHPAIETMYPGITAYTRSLESVVLSYWVNHKDELRKEYENERTQPSQ